MGLLGTLLVIALVGVTTVVIAMLSDQPAVVDDF